MYKIFKQFIYENFKIFKTRYSENIKYIQGMFYSNTSKMNKTNTTVIINKVTKSIKIDEADDYEVLDLRKPDDDSLLKEVQLTSE